MLRELTMAFSVIRKLNSSHFRSERHGGSEMAVLQNTNLFVYTKLKKAIRVHSGLSIFNM